MPVIVSMLRGVNVVGRNMIKMNSLRSICGGLRFQGAQTYLQSGNVIFKTREENLDLLSRKIQREIERTCGFRPDVICRTIPELKRAIARNPFATRREVASNKLLMVFLRNELTPPARKAILAATTDPEELQLIGREVYIYYPNGMGRPKFSWLALEKKLKISGTGRNWNTVRKLLEIAENLEASA
jgi:uncharacterized protein (DUF1697 family)